MTFFSQRLICPPVLRQVTEHLLFTIVMVIQALILTRNSSTATTRVILQQLLTCIESATVCVQVDVRVKSVCSVFVQPAFCREKYTGLVLVSMRETADRYYRLDTFLVTQLLVWKVLKRIQMREIYLCWLSNTVHQYLLPMLMALAGVGLSLLSVCVSVFLHNISKTWHTNVPRWVLLY